MDRSTIAAFPLKRRQTLVLEIATTLEEKHGNEANLFWRQTAKRILAELLDLGIDRTSAEDEVRALLHSVVVEMHQRTQAARA